MLGGIFQRWFGKPQQEMSDTVGVRPEESLDDLYIEFCHTFCHKPGVNFMEFLKADGVTRMIDWLQPSNPCPLPGAFIRLAVDSSRKGVKFWKVRDPIIMNYVTNEDRGGLPEQESLDAVSVLAQILEKPVKLYYREQQDGPLMVMVFEP